MRFASLRRRIALTICPELSAPPREVVVVRPPRRERALSTDAAHAADEVRALADTLEAHVGEKLTERVICGLLGIPHRYSLVFGRMSVADFDAQFAPARQLMSMVRRLRKNSEAGVIPIPSAAQVRCTFSRLWPDDLSWPPHIPRPNPKECRR